MAFNIKKPDTQKAENLWPDGWFLYKDDAIHGPYSTEEAFAEKDFERTLISRKGFSRWYKLDEIKSIHTQAENLGLNVEDSTRLAQEKFSKEIAKLAKLEASIKNKESKVVKKKNLSPTQKEAKDPAVKKVAQVSKDILANKVPKTKKQEKKTKELNYANFVEQKASQKAPQPEPKKAQDKASAIQNKNDIAYHHLQLAGRLRLGKLRSPIDESFIKMLMTFGVYWPHWLKTTSKEIQWHLDSTQSKSKLFSALALIPGIHILAAFSLAKKVKELENQNGYQRISLSLAVLFSLFPPFGKHYMQDKLNKHWGLHIHSAINKKSSQASKD